MVGMVADDSVPAYDSARKSAHLHTFAARCLPPAASPPSCHSNLRKKLALVCVRVCRWRSQNVSQRAPLAACIARGGHGATISFQHRCALG